MPHLLTVLPYRPFKVRHFQLRAPAVVRDRDRRVARLDQEVGDDLVEHAEGLGELGRWVGGVGDVLRGGLCGWWGGCSCGVIFGIGGRRREDGGGAEGVEELFKVVGREVDVGFVPGGAGAGLHGSFDGEDWCGGLGRLCDSKWD